MLLRIWLPDRPGALGLVASRIGALRGDIVGVEVLERDQGTAVDEVAVVLPDSELIDLLAGEIEEVDGVSVEEVRRVDAFPDPRLDALDGAALLVEATSVGELHTTLVDQLRREFLADWSALTGSELLARAGPAPTGEALDALVSSASTGRAPTDVVVAPLSIHAASVLVGRDGHPLRRLERAQLAALARVADRIWMLLES